MDASPSQGQEPRPTTPTAEDYGVSQPAGPAGPRPDAGPFALREANGALLLLARVEGGGHGLWVTADEGLTWGHLGYLETLGGNANGTPYDASGRQVPALAEATGRLVATGYWRLADGTTAVAGREGARGILVSQDGGSTWQASEVPGLPIEVGSTWLAANGSEVWLVAHGQAQGAGQETGHAEGPQGTAFVARSVDGGMAWTAAGRLPQATAGWLLGDPVAAGNGFLLVPLARPARSTGAAASGTSAAGLQEAGAQPPLPALAVTRDGGATYAIVPVPWSDAGAVPSVAIDGAGTLHVALLRTQEGATRVWHAASRDGGASWDAARPVTPPGFVAQAARLEAGAAGRLAVATYAAAGSFEAAAAPLQARWFPAVAFTTDGGATWAQVRMAPDGPPCGPAACADLMAGGPAMALTPDGRVAIAYADAEARPPGPRLVVQRGGPGLL